MPSNFEKDEFIKCSSCKSHINYFKLCKTLDTKWNNGEKKKCSSLVCNKCDYCEKCRGKIKTIVDQIQEKNKCIEKLEDELKKEYGTTYLNVEDIKY